MNRRDFGLLFGLGALLAFASRNVTAEPDIRVLGNTPQGWPVVTAGIPSFVMNQVAEKQYLNQWCWAACISSVFNFYGVPINQARIVRDAYGQVVNLPGNFQAIFGSLNRVWVDDRGRRFKVEASPFNVNVVSAIEDLKFNHPLILGSLGHAVVLTALNFVSTPQGPQVIEAIVRDPWPGNPDRRVLTPQEWYNINLAARIRVFPF